MLFRPNISSHNVIRKVEGGGVNAIKYIMIQKWTQITRRQDLLLHISDSHIKNYESLSAPAHLRPTTTSSSISLILAGFMSPAFYRF